MASWANNRSAGGFSGGVLFSAHFVNFDKSEIQIEIIRPGSMPKKLLKVDLTIQATAGYIGFSSPYKLRDGEYVAINVATVGSKFKIQSETHSDRFYNWFPIYIC